MHTLACLAEHLGGDWRGNTELPTHGVASLSTVSQKDIAYFNTLALLMI